MVDFVHSHMNIGLHFTLSLKTAADNKTVTHQITVLSVIFNDYFEIVDETPFTPL